MVSKADREILEQVEDDFVRPREETKGDDDTDADVAGDSEVVVEPASGVNATSGRFIRNIASAAATTIGSLEKFIMTKQETTGDDLVEKTRSEEAEITQGDQEPTTANLLQMEMSRLQSILEERNAHTGFYTPLDYALNQVHTSGEVTTYVLQKK